jgi:hypothetical protein
MRVVAAKWKPKHRSTLCDQAGVIEQTELLPICPDPDRVAGNTNSQS